ITSVPAGSTKSVLSTSWRDRSWASQLRLVRLDVPLRCEPSARTSGAALAGVSICGAVARISTVTTYPATGGGGAGEGDPDRAGRGDRGVIEIWAETEAASEAETATASTAVRIEALLWTKRLILGKARR